MNDFIDFVGSMQMKILGDFFPFYYVLSSPLFLSVSLSSLCEFFFVVILYFSLLLISRTTLRIYCEKKNLGIIKKFMSQMIFKLYIVVQLLNNAIYSLSSYYFYFIHFHHHHRPPHHHSYNRNKFMILFSFFFFT